ncbi:MAG TPA: hypothetical protein VFU15_12470 [Bacteroidia bacterium]|nr:hypothetical protein [Bacteroidia bacterium]
MKRTAALLSFLILVIAAGRHSQAHPHRVPAADSLEASTDSILKFWLSAEAVTEEKPVCRTLWLWTSASSIDSALYYHSLLWSYRPQSLPAEFYRGELENKKWNKDPLAQVLRSGSFGRTYDAWNNCWAALADAVSFEGNTQLVKVDLGDSALIVVFRPENKRHAWTVYDLEGNSLSIADALKRKDQIAVVYYSSRKTNRMKGYAGSYPPTNLPGCRSFILCNEKMIKGWGHAVPGLQDKLNSELNYLLLLKAWFAEKPGNCSVAGKNGKNTMHAWAAAKNSCTTAQLCMKNFRYGSVNAGEEEIRNVIDKIRKNGPKQVNPVQKFPSRGIR